MQAGKARIRLQQQGPGYIHLHRQLAAALLLPYPVREDESLAGGLPVPRSNQYAIENIHLSDVQLTSDGAHLIVGEVELRNMSYHAQVLGFNARVARVRALWDNAQSLPAAINSLITAHRSSVYTPGPITESTEGVIRQLQAVVTISREDLGLTYRSEDEDVLPDLETVIQLTANPPAEPIAVTQIDPGETQVKRRVVAEWKRWANSRGTASAIFRQQVRAAYNATCVVCGVHLPPTSINAVPGVDAAHILPWADYDLDVVANGLCLCKLHHWAFDEGLIVIREEGGTYFVEVPDIVAATIPSENPLFGLNQLTQFVGPIPEERLPSELGLRPNPHFLHMLRET
jgi:hypothetical protein